MRNQTTTALRSAGLLMIFLLLGWMAGAQTQLGQDIDGEATGDRSGYSLSLSADGSRVAIGAIFNGDNGSYSGHTRIYAYNGSSWLQLGMDIDGEAGLNDSGYSVSLSADGSRVAIGAPYNNGNGIQSGHTRIYEYNGTNWVQLGMDIDGEASGDLSGWSVSLSADGNRLAVGALGNDNNGGTSGHTRIYEYNGTNWVQLGMDIDGEAGNDQSGRSVSLSADGSRVAIGAHGNDGNGSFSGHTRIYEYNGVNWVQLGVDINGEAGGDQSGWSVSLSADGNIIAIGSPEADGNGSRSGHTRVFQYNGGNWVQLGQIIAGEGALNGSGWSVALSADGNTIAIGGRTNSEIGTFSGHVRVFEYDGSSWIQFGNDIDGENTGDQSGFAVDLSADGSRVAIGAPFNDGNGDNSGQTRVYILTPPDPLEIYCTNVEIFTNVDCQGNAAAEDFYDGASDPNFVPTTFSVSPEGPYWPGSGPTTVTLTVSDGERTGECTATITVEDNLPPLIDCPGDDVVSTDPGQCSAEYFIPYPDALDNCGDPTISYRYRLVDDNCNDLPGTNWSNWTTASVQQLGVGQWKIEWRAVDFYGYENACSFCVTVVDNEAPVAVCQDVTVQLDPSGAAVISTDDVGVLGGAVFTDSGQSLGNSESFGMDLGDLDGDGDLDAFVVNLGQGNQVWRNNGSGFFTNSGQSLGNGYSYAVELGDLDGDGDLDAFVVNFNNPNRVWINNGSGLFTDSGQSLGGSNSYGLSLGDVDGDGDLDAFVVNQIYQGNKVWINNGAGTFTDSGQSLGNAFSSGVELGDVDGDGDLDAFVANDGANIVWTNNGAGTFTDSGQSLGSGSSYSPSLGDVDGDGDLDAFVANFNQADRVWTNNGMGTFTDSGQSLGSTSSFGTDLGDVDGDGDLDAYVVSLLGEANKVWINNGSGLFTDSGQALGNSYSWEVALGDLDNDGDLDAYVANGSGQGNIVWFNNPQAGISDNCGIASLALDWEIFTCSDVGSNTVTLTVTDVNGNTDACTATVTVEDNVAPTAVCQDVTIQLLDSAGDVPLTVADVDNGSSDACGIASLSLDRDGVNCTDVGTLVATLTVVDVNGNSASCPSTITIEDNIAPTAICQDVTVQLDTDGNGMATAAAVDNGSSDACGIASLALDTETFTCADVGSNTVTLTVTDVNGNTDACTATVVVEDNVAPTAVCQDVTIQLVDSAGDVPLTVDDVDNGSSDACGIASISLDGDGVNCMDVGTLVATLTVVDVNGNSASCPSTITIEDNIAPTAICQDVTVQLDTDGNTTTTAAAVDNGSSDACGIASLALDTETFTCADVGTAMVTLTVTDVNGNVDNCMALVTVEDNLPPTALCQDITVQLDAYGNATAAAAAIDNGSNDACGIASLALDTETFTCADIGANTVTLMVTDVNGSVDNCTASVTVEDNNPPTALCSDITVYLSQGTASIIAADINGGSSSVCNDVSLSADQTTFDCSHTGPNTVTLTVTDTGNTLIAECEATVTVVDPDAFCCAGPVAICNDVTVELDADGLATTTAALVGAGSTADCGLQSETIDFSSFTCAEVGEQIVIYTITDSNGASDNCTAKVTVEDNIRPSITCSGGDIVPTNPGMCSFNYNLTPPVVDDNCGVTVLRYRWRPTDENGNNTGPWSSWSTAANQIFAVGHWKIQWQAKDAAGNQRRCSYRIEVEDAADPSVSCPASMEVANDPGDCGAIVDFVATATDNCSGVSIAYSQDPGTFFPLGTTTVTVTATDASGRFKTCSFDVVVNDTERPTLNCSGMTITVPNDPGECAAEVELPTPIAEDNCGVETLEYRYREVDEDNNALGPWSAWADVSEAYGTFAVGRYRIRWRAFDAAGNKRACTRFLTVEDVEVPTVDCFNQTITFNGEASIPLLVDDLAEASDNCGVASLTLDVNEVSCEQLGEEITVTATAVDVNGLENMCTSKVYIEGLPCGWSQEPDGVGCEDGSEISYDLPSETYTLNSSDCHNSPTTNGDEYAFGQYNLCGNGEIIAQVTDISGTSFGWAGVIMRESNDPQAKSVALMTNLSANHRREARVTTGGTVTSQLMPSLGRHWLRIQRFGNQFRAYSSFNGMTWFLRFSQTIPMEECIEVGLVVNGYNGSSQISATFANVSIQGTTFFESQANAPVIEETVQLKTFSVFPNPTAGQVTIALGDYLEQEARLEVLDVNGQLVQLVREGILEHSTEELNLGQLPAGLYFVRLQLSDGTVQTQRVVLQPRS